MKFKEPITIEAIDLSELGEVRLQKPIFSPREQGSFVAVRKAGEEKTKLGLYLGDLPLSVGGRIVDGEDGKTLVVGRGVANPCIFVFEDNQFVFGLESWWGKIESADQLREITDDDISNVWYVRALTQMQGSDEASA